MSKFFETARKPPSLFEKLVQFFNANNFSSPQIFVNIILHNNRTFYKFYS